jgi:hypothetical protein
MKRCDCRSYSLFRFHLRCDHLSCGLCLWAQALEDGTAEVLCGQRAIWDWLGSCAGGSYHVAPKWLAVSCQLTCFTGSKSVFSYSPKNGTIKVGAALASPQAVVPAPPWWTTAATRLNSHSWGQSSRKKTWSFDSRSSPSLLQPREIRARVPVIFSACMIVSVKALGSSITMLPKPMYIGLVPSVRNLAKFAEGSYAGASLKKKPQTSMD